MARYATCDQFGAREADVSGRVLRWLFFGLVISFVPLAVAYGNLALKSQALSLAKITGKGEVLLICGSLCAGALGELIGTRDRFSNAKIFVGGVTLVITFFCGYFFASIEEQLAANETINQAVLLTQSSWALGLCVVSSISCLILAEA